MLIFSQKSPAAKMINNAQNSGNFLGRPLGSGGSILLHGLFCLHVHGPESALLITSHYGLLRPGPTAGLGTPAVKHALKRRGICHACGRSCWPCAAERRPRHCLLHVTACPTICAPILTALLAGLRVVPCRHGFVQGRARAPKNRHSSDRRLRHPARRGAAGLRRRAQGTGPAYVAPQFGALPGQRLRCMAAVALCMSVATQGWHRSTRLGLGVAPYTSMSRPRVPPRGPWCAQAIAACPSNLPAWGSENLKFSLVAKMGHSRAAKMPKIVIIFG